MNAPHPYASLAYASAFAPHAEPIYLEEAQTFVLKRSIPGTPYYDAMGCYPLSPLNATGDLAKDFSALKARQIVSLVLVTDPFFHPPVAALQLNFDQVSPYKEHYVHDYSGVRAYSKHHRYEVRRALRAVEVRPVALPEYLGAWCELYGVLVQKQAITGIQAFSKAYFTALCALEPLMFGAFINDRLVCAHIAVSHHRHAYSHLGASSDEGYRLGATYAVYDYMLHYFAGKADRFDLGGGSGIAGASQGLVTFKKGFSNASAPCYLCGKIFNEEVYATLSKGKATTFFPAYRG